jgi:hypothetical protein
MKNIILTTALIGGTLLFNLADASDVQWTFQNSTLTDGASVTGSFVYDTSTGLISDASISLSAGSANSANSFNSGYLNGAGTIYPNQALFGPASLGALQLNLQTSGGYLNSGGTVSIITGLDALVS